MGLGSTAWSATAGSIDGNGLLTAPDVAVTGTVTATSGGLSGSAAFMVAVVTVTWTAGGTDTNWSDAANWGGSAPAADEILQFGGTAGLDSQNDLAPGTRVNGITFQNDAGAFVLSGNAVNLGGDVVNNSLATQTIALPLALVGGNCTLDAASGNLRISGAIRSSGGQFGIITTGPGAVILSGTNTYTGGTVVNAGTLEVANSNALPDGGNLTVGAGATGAFDSGSGTSSAVSAADSRVGPDPGYLRSGSASAGPPSLPYILDRGGPAPAMQSCPALQSSGEGQGVRADARKSPTASSADSFFGTLPAARLPAAGNVRAVAAFWNSLQSEPSRQRTKNDLAVQPAVAAVLAADWG
jgi:autotransporter-associated beta strand protein